MAEFCYDCYKKVLNGEREEDELVLSKDLNLCEGCGKYKNVVLRSREPAEIFLRKFLNAVKSISFFHNR